MSRMSRTPTAPQPPPVQFLNLVPTMTTRRLAARMIHAARKDAGADAVMELIGDLNPDQTAALIGVLLDAVNSQVRVNSWMVGR